MASKKQAWTIGELAKAANVGVETIRYYQRRGLINEPKRPPGGFRRYGSNDLTRLKSIRHTQQLGFSLDEINELLSLNAHKDRNKARELAEEKIALIDSRIRELEVMRKVLAELVDSCSRADKTLPCPILRSLTRTEKDMA